MDTTNHSNSYTSIVHNKFKVYNSLFMNLPYEKVENIGMLLPLLQKECKKGLDQGMNPKEIIDAFFAKHTDIFRTEDKIDFFFRVIQYIERQVVLFDSIEDARLIALSKMNIDMPFEQFYKRLHQEDIQNVVDKLSEFGTRIVFTAHPTQFYPLPVLDIINNLREQILHDDLQAIDISLQQLGMTSFTNDTKPTPFEEAKNIIYYLRHVYYHAVGELFENLIKLIPNGESFDNYDIIKLGFWPGGDRDGNPFVTAKITQQVADELRTTLYKCYYNELKTLRSKLTFKKVRGPFETLMAKLYESMFNVDSALPYNTIIQHLEEIQSIINEHYNGLFADDIKCLIHKVHIFKTHFAVLDIRQDSSIHRRMIDAIIDKYSISKSSADTISVEEVVRLIENPPFELNADDFADDLIKDTITNIKNLRNIQEKNGTDGCERYIISNSEKPQDVLLVYLFFRLCGYAMEDINFDIVPLFETMKGMNDSKLTMDTLFNIDFYRKHIQKRNDKHTIMLGFSDGTKDGGYLQANWNIHKTKERLSLLCAAYDVKAVFFDGRGGPPARGGGKTQQFYAAQSKNIANNEIQLTIQGQTITSTYGTKEAFIFNVEQLITAGMERHIEGKIDEDRSKKQKALMEELGGLSFEKYTSLKQHPQFIPYLEQMSTLKYYSNANIGSRPGKRGNKKELTLSDLRAISFVGSWSQLKQNVPGYFGIGTAIKAFKEMGRFDEVEKLFRENPFFKALILNSMMSLSKSYFPLTSYMKDFEQFKEFWEILHAEYLLSIDMLIEVSGYESLMEEEPTSKMSIAIREGIVLPLLTIQQYALQSIKEEDKYIDVYKKIVTRSLYGNINASRNSA